ncbi:MAG TPA: GNAT family N-acetyltransferase [Solirubrobacterales bacterium]|nr:GNAT family N-acetyltransferase [Solirubrobacterales bacterium]
MTYPDNLTSDVVLRDGSTVAIRPLQAGDEPLLLEFFESLDERSLAFRFFTGAPNLHAAAEILSDVDQRRRFGLLALRGPEERVVAHGFFGAIDAESAEVAFAVADELQGHGLGSIMLAHLAEHAAEEGFTTFVADVMPQNHAMLGMFRDAGFPVTVRSEPGAIVVEMPISTAPEAIARFQEHDAAAARAAVAGIFDRATVAALDAGPKEAPELVREAAARGARAVVVGGDPGAWGGPGSAAGRELLATCRAAGVRLVGPASAGVLDNRPRPPLAVLAEGEGAGARAGFGRLPRRGRVGVCSQGVAASRELLAAAARHRVGVSEFVSLGDRADITANDLLEYWEEDPATVVALLQVESFSDPRRFGRVARRVGSRLPIVVIAARAAAEPPGRGLFDAVGAIRADGIEEGLHLAASLARRRHRSPPRPIPAPVTVPGARSDEAAAILAAALAAGGTGWGAEATVLDPEAGARLLDCYGIALDGSTAAAARVPALAVSVAADPLFGPVLRCGRADEPAAARQARLCPLDDDDAADLLDASDLVATTTEREALERALEATAALAAEHAEVSALELDPLLATPGGARAAGARVKVRRPPERRPWPRTWE